MYSLEPCCGSFLGGTVINVYGKGFGSNTFIILVHVGQEPCTVLKASDEIITCQTPPYLFLDPNEENITVPLIVFIANMTSKKVIPDLPTTGDGDLTFTYHRVFTPTISNLSWFLENGSLWLNLTGANVKYSVIFFENAESEVEYKVTYKNLQSSNFAISLDHFTAGNYCIKVYQANLGFANITSEKMFKLEPQVSSLSPREDCIEDRTFHISGTGFSPGNTVVTICGSPCELSGNLTTTTDLYCSNWKLNNHHSGAMMDLIVREAANEIREELVLTTLTTPVQRPQISDVADGPNSYKLYLQHL
ncbi:unnamed protein product, partial [Ranitomeya imitator]